MIAGGAGGGWLAQKHGWRAPFQLLGVVGLVYLAVLAPVMRRARVATVAAPPPFLGSLRELMHLPGYGWMAAVFVGTSLANWMFYTWLPLYLYEHFHMSLAGAGACTTFTYVASVGGIIAGGWLGDRWGSTTARGRLLTQAVGVCAGAPALFALSTTTSHGVLAAGLVVFGVGKGLYDANIMPVLAQVARPELRSTGYGVFNFLGCLAGGISAPLAGWMKSGIGLEGALLLGAGVLLLSSALLVRTRIPEGKALRSYEPISDRA
jgi:MFS family permease